MRRRRGAIVAAAALAGLGAVPAAGSGGPEPAPHYVDHHGGTAAELARLYRGRLGIVMARSHSPMLYLQWRLLHGLDVGPDAGEALAPPWLGQSTGDWQPDGIYAWLDARAQVPGREEHLYHLPTDRPGPDYTRIPNCFPGAFETAAATLRARVASHGRDAPAVRAWVLTQDGVFDACGSAAAALPPAMADSPLWLRADRAYQEAAFALYHRRNAEAALRFTAIARDRSSPWQHMGLYLAVRALYREALAQPGPERFAIANRALAALAATPAATYGKGEAGKMIRALAYRERPARLLAELDGELGRREPAADLEISLRDYLSLGRTAPVRPDAADWILTLKSDNRAAALGHARARWDSTRDVAWLIAALALASPGDAAAGPLAADAERVEPGHVGWLAVRYHLIRLTIAKVDPAMTRARLGAILARPDLTLSERNLFTAARAQVATDLDDFARFALRRPYCEAASAAFCVEEGWSRPDRTLGRLGGGRWAGLGADARAIVDRLPLGERIALSRNMAVPAPLRLDIALTSFARAVQLQDNVAIDRLADDLALLLPQLARDWRAIAALRPGPARRFATFFVMAKIPGLRPDLVEYDRPRGTVRQFEGHWVDWMIVPRGQVSRPAEFPASPSYRWDNYWGAEEDSEDDLTCLGQCGPGAFPLHLPRFVAARQDEAARERAYFVTAVTNEWDPPRPVPAGALSLWDEALAYARAHPRDPRSPELLYRLIRVARWGGNHNHLGRRAFQLLHRRYPGSNWARRSPYYYDD